LLSFDAESFVFSLLSRNLKIKIYRTLILPVVLYGCETWSLTLREEHRLMAEELNDPYCSQNIVRVIKSRRMRWAGHVARMGKKRVAYRVSVRKPEGKRPVVRPRHRWDDNRKMDLQEVGRGDMDWIDLAPDRDKWRAVVNAVMKLRVP
jgi:hypothetical protein